MQSRNKLLVLHPKLYLNCSTRLSSNIHFLGITSYNILSLNFCLSNGTAKAITYDMMDANNFAEFRKFTINMFCATKWAYMLS